VILGGWSSMQKLKETLNEVDERVGDQKALTEISLISFLYLEREYLSISSNFHLRKEERSYTYSFGPLDLWSGRDIMPIIGVVVSRPLWKIVE
jgi:hypothetical protein